MLCIIIFTVIINLICTNMSFNINKTKIKSKDYGQYCFYIGTLLLSTTTFLAGFFYLISLVISFSRETNFLKKDKWNLSLFVCTIILLLSSINIWITANNSKIYEVLKSASWDSSAIWVGLFNWIPLFLSFYGFQKYINSESQRLRFAKCLFLGTIPVLISIILQKWFQIFGPFEYLNGLVVFYLKEIDPSQGYAGLFNNPNYAGLWLSASLPFCFLILQKYKYKKLKLSFIITIIISTIYCILSTNSRNSLIGIFIALFIMLSKKFLFTFLLVFIILYFLIIGLSSITLFSSLGINEFLPEEIFKKLFQTNYFNKLQFTRIDIWTKAINLISERPLLGWGATTFPILYLLRGGIETAQHTHSMPLEIAQTNGVPLAIILVCFVTLLFLKSWKVIFTKNKNSESIINKAWISSLLIIIISHTSDVTYYDGRVSLLIWILLAGLKCILDEEKIKKINILS